MASYSKYNKNGGLNVQNSTLGNWLTGLFTKKEEPKAEEPKEPVKTAADASRDAYVQQIIAQQKNTEPKTAQQYAQDALNGVGGRYVSPSQVPNAIINAKVPINKVELPKNSSSGNTSGASVNTYLSALQQQNAENQAIREQRRKDRLAALEKRKNERIAALEEQKARTMAELEKQYGQGKQNIADTATDSNKQAYVAYMHGIKNMPQAAAMYGSGGMAQSLANKSQLNYENNRMNVEQAKLASLQKLEDSYRGRVRDADAAYRRGVLDANDAYRDSALSVDDAYYETVQNAKTNYLTQLASLQGKTSGGSSGSGSGRTAYRIGNDQTVYSNLDALIKGLKNMGFTDEEARRYIKRQN